jgi:hypothetical protein
MPEVSDIKVVAVTLNISDKPSLFVLLAADGSINRLGTGAVKNRDNELFIGVTKEPLFDRLMTNLQDSWLDHMGGYDVPDQQGAPCELSIAFSFGKDNDNGFEFRYGSESQGPPEDIARFVIAAIEITEPWFKAQKKMVRRPWWKFW